MTNRNLHIWIVGDGRTGHENQSLGLAEAITRQASGAAIHRIQLAAGDGWFARWRAARAAATTLPAPDLIIGAGHRTHPTLLWLARRHRAPCVVLMRPSLPPRFFDFVIAPRHDFAGPEPPHPHLLLTRGAVNRVRPCDGPRDSRPLVLIGGPSKHHGWDGDGLHRAIATIATACREIEVADSRRTPDGFTAKLANLPGVAAIHHHQSTPHGWLAGKLARAGDVWVGEDSVSMVYEALSGGARVGLLPMPRLRPEARVIRGVDQLAGDHWITRFEDWPPGDPLPASPAVLAEADRAARWLLERLGECRS